MALRLRGPTCSVGRVSVSATRQLQVIAVARNHLLIPVERFLLAAVQRAVAFIVFIDKDKAVAFFISPVPADTVSMQPHGV